CLQAPVFDIPLKPVTVDEGDKLSLRCHVCGSPPLKIQWMKDRKDLTSAGSTRISFSDGTETKLQIREVTKSDSGQYRCVASNKHGEIECSADMHVDEKKEAVVLEGDLRAKLKKTPSKQKSPQEEKDIDIIELLRNVDPKEYEKYARMYGITDYRGLLQAIEQLKKEKAEESGRPVTIGLCLCVCQLEMKGRYTSEMKHKVQKLLIRDLKPEDQGRYTCKYQHLESSADLWVEGLYLETFLEPYEAKFELEISREPKSFRWLKGSHELSNDDKFELSVVGKRHTLIVKSARYEDEAKYMFETEDKRTRGHGQDVRGHAHRAWSVPFSRNFSLCYSLTGLVWFHTLCHCFKLVTTGEKDDVILSCELSKAAGEVRWFKDGNEIFPSKNILFQSDGQKRMLVIRRAAKINMGTYTCDCGTDKTTDQTITDYVTDVGKPIVMTVPYSAYPQAKADWLYDNQSVPKDNIHTSADRTEYRLRDPKKSDEGRYKIIIKNKHGEGEAFINLDVIDVPGPVKNLQVIDTADGEVSLSWEEPESDGGSKIIGYVVERRDVKRKTWTLATDHAESPEYTVTGLQKDSMYLFRVCARNRVGSGPIHLPSCCISDVPDAPLNVIVGNVTKFGCTVSWEPPESDGGSPITSYIIELRDRTSVKWSPVQVTKASELSAVINDVIENKEYIFRVKAENRAGVGKPSAASQPVKIMDPIEPPSPPQNLSWQDQNKTSGIYLTWDPPRYDGGSGIRGYNVERCQRGTDKWEPCADLVPELKCQVTGLTEGQWYSYRVRALNRLGASGPCRATDEIQAVDPKEIRLDAKLLAGLTAKAGSKIELPAEVTGKPEPRVKWTKADLVLKPDDRVSIDTKVCGHFLFISGSRITNYIVERRAADSEIWHRLSTTIKQTTYKAVGLVKFKDYIFRVFAENQFGVGPPAEHPPITAKYPFGRSHAHRTAHAHSTFLPDILEGKSCFFTFFSKLEPSDIAKDSLTLTWFEPDEDGGSPITGYWVERYEPDHDRWIRCNKVPIKDTNYR
uniref:Immunoglobulin like and fibronectin type III domain containing 1, tandem duplicate 2 n=1 Tax=Mastacembelus armatus TaxID=205130 RepID=A0A3Q3SL05_9TELE